MLILASTSPYRKLQLDRLGLPFSCTAPNIEETVIPQELPQHRAIRLAKEKALAVARLNPHAWVIGGDQVAVHPCGQILHKPGTTSKAEQQLIECSGKKVSFYTAICLINLEKSFSETRLDNNVVHFRQLDKASIQYYVEREQPLDCAGSFKSEGLGISLFEKLEGKDPNSLIGMPLISLCTLFLKAGIQPLSDNPFD